MSRRRYVSPFQLAITDAGAYYALSPEQDLCERIEVDGNDLVIFYVDGELYIESHDEQTLFVYRDDKLVELNFDSRPGIS